MIRRAGIVAVGVALAALFYWLLIDSADLPELAVVPGVAVLAGLAFVISGERGLTEAAISPRWLLAAWRPFVRVPVDVVLVLRELGAQLVHPRAARGELRRVEFRGGRDSASVGRIALTESLGSVAPNTIVIGVDPDRDQLLIHQLAVRGRAEELDALGLGSGSERQAPPPTHRRGRG